LVSAINKRGYPTLPTFPHRRNLNNGGGPLEVVLQAIANILVRNTEAISVAASGSSIIVVQGWREDTTGEPDFTSEEKPDPAIMNKDQYKFPNGCDCILVSSSKSLLPTELLSEDALCEHILKEVR
jgi:hypothetical protein